MFKEDKQALRRQSDLVAERFCNREKRKASQLLPGISCEPQEESGDFDDHFGSLRLKISI